MGWNHNVAYHADVLRAVPAGCRRALDVGCGEGDLMRKLAGRVADVVGIDLEAKAGPGFVTGDIMTYPLVAGSFDLITCVATLHHLPLEAGLRRLEALLAPGGVLVVVGLFRMGWVDYLLACVALPASRAMRLARGHEAMRAAVAEPQEGLGEIRRAARRVLPGVRVRRRLFFRYTLVWQKSA